MSQKGTRFVANALLYNCILLRNTIKALLKFYTAISEIPYLISKNRKFRQKNEKMTTFATDLAMGTIKS